MTKLKPFQEETVNTVLMAFKPANKIRRFLIADEVGLGKTVVAQEVIRRMIRARRRPLVVFYVCSSLSIAHQNQAKLLEILDDEAERKNATCPVDRLTLMPATTPPAHPRLHLYTLTPDTSLPVRPGRRRDGKQEERALIQALVEILWPDFLEERGKKFFQRNAQTWWKDWLASQRKKVRHNTRLQRAFETSVRAEFKLEKGHRLVPALREMSALEIIAHFRNALAAGALEEIRPDLVIFDEFQRFRDLLDSNQDDAAERVIGRLRGDGMTNPPALLLLSATPYRLYSARWEDVLGRSHHAEFFDLVEFLYGNGDTARQKRAECEASFVELQRELLKGTPDSPVARDTRQKIQAILRPIIARTERASHPAGWVDYHMYPISTDVIPDDFKVYRHLSDSFAEQHRSLAVSYWTSIPLPMQTMDQHYVVWKGATPAAVDDVPVLSEQNRDLFHRLAAWPHPRLRALREKLLSDRQLTLLWAAPSLPWWPLEGDWAAPTDAEAAGKLLIFSRFQAVPQAVASLISYDLETRLLASESISYAEVTKRKALQPNVRRANLLALFNPSPWLVTVADPLDARSRSLQEIRSYLERKIKRALNQLGISVRQGSRRNRPISKLLAQIEHKAGHGPWIIENWTKLHTDLQRQTNPDAGLGILLQTWQQEMREPLGQITPDELSQLAEYVLGAPGVVLGRALFRHWPEAVSRQGYLATLKAVWNGLRNYLDQRWFFAALKGANDERFPAAIQAAIIQGNLESVLDEHLWITCQLRSLSGAALAQELEESLSLRTSNIHLHQASDKTSTFSLRCHVALPFIKTQQQVRTTSVASAESERPLRADELRRAFNSPFWPHILTTTSIGQEGLDFHVWCKGLVHWDLSLNPVDLEQREGRIQRFGGLAVRQVIARRLGPDVLQHAARHKSPWTQLAQLADTDKTLCDASGLAPWWVCPDATVKRYIFDVPLSRQAQQLAWMQQQRLLYRLVLGQPNQEDLLEVVAQRADLKPETIRQSTLQLSPWFSQDKG